MTRARTKPLAETQPHTTSKAVIPHPSSMVHNDLECLITWSLRLSNIFSSASPSLSVKRFFRQSPAVTLGQFLTKPHITVQRLDSLWAPENQKWKAQTSGHTTMMKGALIMLASNKSLIRCTSSGLKMRRALLVSISTGIDLRTHYSVFMDTSNK